MKKIKADIAYTEISEKDLDMIGPLWLKLRTYHKDRAHEVFKKQFDIMTFADRKKQLLEKSRNGLMLVHLAKDNRNVKIIGYCVSTITDNKQGEVESIFIEAEYRGCGIGDHFMKTALKWMDDQGVTRKTIGVAVGNEEVFGFYEKYNFYPRVSVLVQAEKKE